MTISAGVWFATRPQTTDPQEWPSHSVDLLNGERLFHAGGCASCHGEDLSGGLEIPFRIGWFSGVFRVPNISPDKGNGIGLWGDIDFINAMKHGVAPDGSHYYPSFPYSSYARMNVSDLADLKAYIDTIPAVDNEVAEHDMNFPLTVRRGVGLWKQLNLDGDPVIDGEGKSESWRRGQYLVEGAGHCGECHTPRNRIGGPELDAWLAGAPSPDGEGQTPNITPHEDGLGTWSLSDIEYYLESGFTPDFDAVGGSMVDVQENLARLPSGDRAAIAAYLVDIPALPNAQN